MLPQDTGGSGLSPTAAPSLPLHTQTHLQNIKENILKITQETEGLLGQGREAATEQITGISPHVYRGFVVVLFQQRACIPMLGKQKRFFISHVNFFQTRTNQNCWL